MSARPRPKPETRAFKPGYLIAIAVFGAGIYAIGTAIPKLPSNPRAAEVRLAARPVVEAVRVFRAQHAGRAPLDLAELLAAEHNGARLLVLPDGLLPLDAWGRPLTYHHAGTKHESTYLLSLGADGLEGGQGEDHDIVIGVGESRP
ncbi:MAG: type II secretion system protein GspG [Planctomycetes bacterium]|nr:type II secretion system protein GspG [Planctomycetota bacterium]